MTETFSLRSTIRVCTYACVRGNWYWPSMNYSICMFAWDVLTLSIKICTERYKNIYCKGVFNRCNGVAMEVILELYLNEMQQQVHNLWVLFTIHWCHVMPLLWSYLMASVETYIMIQQLCNYFPEVLKVDTQVDNYSALIASPCL